MGIVLRDLQTVHDVDKLLQVLILLHERHADVLDWGVELQEELCILSAPCAALCQKQGCKQMHAGICRIEYTGPLLQLPMCNDRTLPFLDVFLRQGSAVDLHLWHVDTLAGFQLPATNLTASAPQVPHSSVCTAGPACSSRDHLHLELRVRALFNHLHFHDAIFEEQRGAWLA